MCTGSDRRGGGLTWSEQWPASKALSLKGQTIGVPRWTVSLLSKQPRSDITEKRNHRKHLNEFGVVYLVMCLPSKREDVTLILKTHMTKEAGSDGTHTLGVLVFGKQREAEP